MEINDKRTQKEFKSITFSGFEKRIVKKKLINAVKEEKIEEANYWVVEYVCSGHFLELWDIIILIYSKHIHLGNPKFITYLQIRYEAFRNIVSNGYIDNEIKMRNNPKIRQLFCEIITVLCLSNKKHSFDSCSIKKDDFLMVNMTQKLKAPSLDFATPIFMNDDPKELFICINEFSFCISKKERNLINGCYWLEWLIAFESTCKKDNNEKIRCQPRSFINIDKKYSGDIIWIIWDALLYEGTKRPSIYGRLLKSCLEIFTIRYTPGTKRKRKYLIYFAICLLTEPHDITTSIISNSSKIQVIMENINLLYKQIKKNEIKPDTDYLFNGLSANNSVEKTIKKLETLSNFDFIPRK